MPLVTLPLLRAETLRVCGAGEVLGALYVSLTTYQSSEGFLAYCKNEGDAGKAELEGSLSCWKDSTVARV